MTHKWLPFKVKSLDLARIGYLLKFNVWILFILGNKTLLRMTYEKTTELDLGQLNDLELHVCYNSPYLDGLSSDLDKTMLVMRPPRSPNWIWPWPLHDWPSRSNYWFRKNCNIYVIIMERFDWYLDKMIFLTELTFWFFQIINLTLTFT